MAPAVTGLHLLRLLTSGVPQTVSVLDAVNGVTAIPFAVVGFGVTFWQLRKTKDAANAASDAARRAQRQISRGNILMLLPQIQRIEDELERAIQLDQVQLAISWLATWRWQAGQLRGLLPNENNQRRRLHRSLQASISVAAETKIRLLDPAQASDLVAITNAVRAAIAAVTNELGALAVEYGASTEEGS